MTNLFEWLKSHIWSVIALILGAVIPIFVIVQRPTGIAPWVLAAVFLGIAIYFIGKIRSGGTAEDGAQMPPEDRRLLTGYLLLTGVIFVYMLVSLSAIDFPEPVVQPEQRPNPLATPTNGGVSQPVAQEPATSGAANRSAAGGPGPTPTPTPTPVPRPLLLADVEGNASARGTI